MTTGSSSELACVQVGSLPKRGPVEAEEVVERRGRSVRACQHETLPYSEPTPTGDTTSEPSSTRTIGRLGFAILSEADGLTMMAPLERDGPGVQTVCASKRDGARPSMRPTRPVLEGHLVLQQDESSRRRGCSRRVIGTNGQTRATYPDAGGRVQVRSLPLGSPASPAQTERARGRGAGRGRRRGVETRAGARGGQLPRQSSRPGPRGPRTSRRARASPPGDAPGA